MPTCISKTLLNVYFKGRVDCIRSASSEALEWAKAMCQGEGANVALESDRDDEEDARKVKFSIYSVSSVFEISQISINIRVYKLIIECINNNAKI